MKEPGGTYLSCHTYHHPSLGQHKSCLDRMYMTHLDKWVGCVQPVLYSDHYVVFLFLPSSTDLGPRSWKFPEDLLEDVSFCSQVELSLDNFRSSTVSASWESIKLKIQSIAQEQTMFRQKQAKYEMQALQRNLCSVNKQIYEGESLE